MSNQSQKEQQLPELKVTKSNSLISAKYKTTLLESQLLTIGMSRIEEGIYKGKKALMAKIYPSELKWMLDMNMSNIYTRLGLVAKNLQGHTIVFEDGQGNFDVSTIVVTATYINGVFTIYFNSFLEEYLLPDGKNIHYTTMDLATLTSFKSHQSFRIYEILRKEIFKYHGEPVRLLVGIAELKCMIGLVEMENEVVKRKINTYKEEIDWDEVFEIAPIKKYSGKDGWGNFERKVLKPAQEEINKSTDVYFEYTPIREGRRGYKKLEFKIWPNVNTNKNSIEKAKRILKRDGQVTFSSYQYPELFEKYEGHNYLQKEDLELFLQEAGGDSELVIKSIEQADKQAHLTNYPGWIRACIRAGGYEGQESLHGSTDMANKMRAMQEYIHSDEGVQSFWEKIKESELFEEFAQDTCTTAEEMEFVYKDDYTKMSQLFYDWKLSRNSKKR